METGGCMAKPPQKKPTDGELEILAELWEHGPMTVRQVHDLLEPARGVGYTTVLKLMQIMFEKGLLDRDESNRSHIYRAKPRQQAMQRELIADLVNKVFGGSTEQLVMQALSAKHASPDELAEIRRLLDELEGESP
jgi:predicted transcriptional regulator